MKKTEMELIPTVKNVCALAMSCAAMTFKLVSVVISIPAQIAGWGSDKLMNSALKLAGVGHTTCATYKKGWDEFFTSEDKFTPNGAE